LVPPFLDVLVELDAVLPAVSWKVSFVRDLHRIANAFPEGTDGSDLHVGQRAPFVPFNPRDGFDDEDGECVEKVGIRYLPGFDVLAMQIIHTRDSLNGSLGTRVIDCESVERFRNVAEFFTIWKTRTLQ
jgi:hypothetical protein